ncbi:putative extracellular lipase [Xylariaceae sp. FL0804]|nr:putative extracellular lipase [Xylariaceae sp. FL0804]
MAAAAAVSTTTTDEARPRVVLPQGTVVGIRQTGAFPHPVDAFLGIPYALPPTGERRFRPPQPVPVPPAGSSPVIIDASRFGPRAPAKQFVVRGPDLATSEDCLTANVFRQSGTGTGTAPLLPVAVYFHGGAFNRGNAAMYDAASMVGWAAAPLLVVSCGYRIGALGFLPSALSAREGALNLGLKDQILLMEWVQDNIGRFGGDKDNIGHHLLNVEEGGRRPPPFRRAVMESGAPTSRAVRRFDAPLHERQFADFLAACGLRPVPDDDEANNDDDDVFPRLRALPIETVARAQTEVFARYNPSLRWAFQPVIDGEVIRGRPIDGWRSGRWHRVPILTGFNGNEGSLYVPRGMSESAEFTDFFRTLLPQLSDADIAAIDALYPDPAVHPDSPYREDRTGTDTPGGVGVGVGAQYRRVEAAYAHYAYVAPVRQTAHFAGPHVPTYLYHWAAVASAVGGASHGDNMDYEARAPAVCDRSPVQDKLSGVLHAYITSFICTGDPNALPGAHPDRPTWEPHTGSNKKKMVFGLGNEERVGGGPGTPAALVDDDWAARESDFWWDRVEISQQ